MTQQRRVVLAQVIYSPPLILSNEEARQLVASRLGINYTLPTFNRDLAEIRKDVQRRYEEMIDNKAAARADEIERSRLLMAEFWRMANETETEDVQQRTQGADANGGAGVAQMQRKRKTNRRFVQYAKLYHDELKENRRLRGVYPTDDEGKQNDFLMAMMGCDAFAAAMTGATTATTFNDPDKEAGDDGEA